MAQNIWNVRSSKDAFGKGLANRRRSSLVNKCTTRPEGELKGMWIEVEIQEIGIAEFARHLGRDLSNFQDHFVHANTLVQ